MDRRVNVATFVTITIVAPDAQSAKALVPVSQGTAATVVELQCGASVALYVRRTCTRLAQQNVGCTTRAHVTLRATLA